jgi:hypothetical protein
MLRMVYKYGIFILCILLCVIYRIYDIYSKDSLHNNISERTTKYTLMCQHSVLFVAHAHVSTPVLGHHQANDEYKL